ncbi:alpha/beta fold hydrolase [Allosphingosinicella sp.]|uniref:alpha/beta fold hydrolase n=1 Tax=Allosphingosinicella sp. TaxID=2823234 RepID=UPI0037836F8D
MSLLAALSLLAAPPAILPRDCPQPIAAQARCGTLEVPEDRTRTTGRKIRLNIVIVPAAGPVRLPPLFDLEGGPGLPSTHSAGFYLTDGAAYRAGRDVVLVDQRGTGGSNPLYCAELDDLERQYQPLYPTALVDACRARLSAHADLAYYGTDAAAEDMDAVRGALGAERIDLVALSYGTTLALRYATLHPERVRAMVLFGTVPPEARPPQGHAPAATHALGLIVRDCAATPACRRAYPELGRELSRASGRLPASLSREVFVEKLRNMMYAPDRAARIPQIIHAAAAGDSAPFYAATRRTVPSELADGLYLSITCSESMAGMDYRTASEASMLTPFGNYRLVVQRGACRHWPGFTPAADFFAPPTPAMPLLMISGERDPVSPSDWAESIVQRSPHARHVVLPGGGHVLDGMEGVDTCLDPLVVRFLENADIASLDTACVAAMRPPAFVTE